MAPHPYWLRPGNEHDAAVEYWARWVRGTVAATAVCVGLSIMIATGVMDLGAYVDHDGVLQATLGLAAVHVLAVLWSLYWLRGARRRAAEDRRNS